MNIWTTSLIAANSICLYLASEVAADSGWYLLKPPLRQDISDEQILKEFPGWRTATESELHEIAPSVMGDWNAPLSRWSHLGSFDTAEKCETVRMLFIKDAEAREPENRRKYPGGYPTLETTLLRNSRCIGSGDPRLSR